jgi:hypothetical protein
MSRPLIGNRNSWASFERCVLEVFVIALNMLCDKKSLPIQEDNVQEYDSLNRRLYICLLDSIKEWERINETDIVVIPEPNLGKQPDLENEEEVHEYERKKPDFQWKFRDRLAGYDSHLSRNFEFRSYDIECKRLGVKSSLGRNLAKEYVSKGVFRFIAASHRYGQFSSSGLMVGYVQDADLLLLLSKVNDASQDTSFPDILLSPEGWKIQVSRLDQKLNRLEVQPTTFDLRHLWVDLRHQYNLEKST